MSIAEIIKQAIFSQNNESRIAAEKILLETLHSDPNSFLKQVLDELLKETNEPTLRHASAAIIKRAVLLNTGEGYIWLKLNADIKKQIKTSLLGNLITKDYNAMKGTADVISSIASIEIPRNEWNELIPLLIQNVSHQNIDVKKAAIITLGYICDQLKSSNNSNSIDVNSKELILKGILVGLSQTETNRDIILTSIKALHDSLNMMESLFEKKDIFNYFMKLILENCIHSDIQIKIASLRCLIDFSKPNILKLPEIIESMLQILTNLILDKDTEVAIPAIELFNTIAEEEKDNFAVKNIQNFQMTAKISPALINLLLQNLMKGSKGEDDNDDEGEGGLTIRDTSYRCLCSIVELLGDSCIETIAVFVSNLIASENLTHKRASLYAFSALMDGPSKEKVQALINPALIPILELLFHKDVKVKKTSAFTICRIAEFHSISILKHSNFNDILPKLMEALNDRPEISKKICSTLGFISDSLKNLNGENFFVSHVENIINTLIKNSVREDLAAKDLNLIESTFSAVMNIIHNLQNPTIIEKYLKLFVGEAKLSESLPANRRENLMNGILSTIQACVLGLQGKIEDALAQEIYHLVIQNFESEKKINSQGLHIISALAISISSDFKKFIPNFSPYLIAALTNINEPDILKAAIGNISDICRVCEHDFEGFLMQILPGLISSLSNHNFDKYIKLNIFSCIGDISLGCPKVLIPYLENILTIYDAAFQAAIAISNSNNAEALDYVEELKEKLIESFTCFIHSFSNATPQSEILMSHFYKLMEFIQQTCDSRVNPTIEYIRNCLNLIGDIGKYYRSKVSHIIKITTTQNLLNILRKYVNDEDNKFAVEYVSQVIQAI